MSFNMCLMAWFLHAHTKITNVFMPVCAVTYHHLHKLNEKILFS